MNAILAPLLARSGRDDPYLWTQGPEGWEALSWRALLLRAQRFARLFLAAGPQPGAPLFLMLRPHADAHAAFLGGMLAGAMPAFLPLPSAKQDPALYWPQHRTLFAKTGPVAILAEDELLEPLAGVAPLLRRADADAMDDAPLPRLPGEDAVALLQHSSGTTGLKKGVALSFRAVGRQADAYAARLGLGEEAATVASWLPLYHDMGLMTALLMPMLRGDRVVAMDPFTWVARPALMLEAIARFGATHAWMPSFAFQLLAQVTRDPKAHDLSSMRAWVSCSEPCRPEAFEAFSAKLGIARERLTTCYAMAETVFAISQPPPGQAPQVLELDREALEAERRVRPARPGQPSLRLLSNGPPLEGCAVEARADGRRLAEDEVGELHIRAPFLFDGYNRDPAATAAALRDGWYATGDLGFVRDGEVFVSGRLKDLIIVAGRNLHAGDVEAAVHGIAGLKPGRAVAFGQPDARLGTERLVLLAEHDGSPPPDLVARCNEAVLASLGVPCGLVRIVPPGWMVKTTSGKVSRVENARKFEREGLG